MLDIGWAELLVIGALALIVVGPDDLPGMLRKAGRIVARARGMAREFQGAMEDAAREADLKEVTNLKRDMAKWSSDFSSPSPKTFAKKMLSGEEKKDADPAPGSHDAADAAENAAHARDEAAKKAAAAEEEAKAASLRAAEAKAEAEAARLAAVQSSAAELEAEAARDEAGATKPRGDAGA